MNPLAITLAPKKGGSRAPRGGSRNSKDAVRSSSDSTRSSKGSTRTPRGSRWAIRLRRAIQLLSLLVYFWLFLATAYSGYDRIGPQVNWFLRFDPLLLVGDILANRVPYGPLLWSLVLVGATVVLGRFFCGWVCPLGTVLDGFSRLFFIKKKLLDRPGLRNVKYYLLIALLIPIPFFAHLMGLLDPLCVLTRSLAIAIFPASTFLADKLGTFYESPIAPVTEPIYQFLRAHFIPVGEPTWHWVRFWPTLIVFVAILAMEWLGRRFWCRYLCPLGALLSAISVFAFLRRRPARVCKDCGECQPMCKAGAFGESGALRTAECLQCLRCDTECPYDRVRYSFRKPQPARTTPDLTRRSLVTSLAAGAVIGPVAAVMPRGAPPATLLRPPGVLDEDGFLQRCARCGACTKVCPPQGLTALFLGAGPGAMWTPALNPTAGYCEYKCTLCGQVCPTGAIPRLTELQKPKAKMGTAIFDREKCIPYAKKENCLVCEEVCPTPKKAIVFDARRVDTPDGPKDLLFPRVKRDLCVGCGICEFKCPLEQHKGIITYRPEAVPPELPPPEGEPIDVEQIKANADPYGGYGDQ